MDTNHSGIFGELSRRDFLGYSSLGMLAALIPGSKLSAQPQWMELNLLFKTKLGVKFVLGGMVHETAHEGPCRTGRLENLTYRAEARSFEKQLDQFEKELKSREFPSEAKILKPVGWFRTCCCVKLSG